MSRLTQGHSRLLPQRRYLLTFGLCLGLCPAAQAFDASGVQYPDPVAQYANTAEPTIICGKQPGQHPLSLNIRGADVATLWRSAYRMIFPGLSVADNSKVISRAAMVPHKGPAWSFSVNRDSAVISIQTKW